MSDDVTGPVPLHELSDDALAGELGQLLSRVAAPPPPPERAAPAQSGMTSVCPTLSWLGSGMRSRLAS